MVVCLDADDFHGLHMIRVVRARFRDTTIVALFDVSAEMKMARRTVIDLIQANISREEQSSDDPAAGRVTPDRMGYQLTDRQCEVLFLLRAGLSNKQAARVLDLSEGTVKIHCVAPIANMP